MTKITGRTASYIHGAAMGVWVGMNIMAALLAPIRYGYKFLLFAILFALWSIWNERYSQKVRDWDDQG